MTAPSPEQARPDAAPVCARHSDRVAYVRCQRCERPACPECQRPAPVGIHCVDCVREASRTAPTVRTAFGAPVRAGRPAVTLTLLGLVLGSFLLQLTVPAWQDALIFSPAIGEIEPWRYLTTAFLHAPGNILHLLFNSYLLWMLGTMLEQAFGRWRLLAIFLLSAVGGTVMAMLLAEPFSDAWYTGVIGASGGVFGMAGAMLVALKRLRRDPRQIIVFIVLNAVLGFVIPGISWQGHLGGLVVGIALGAAYAYAPRTRRTAVGIGATVGIAVLLLVVTVAKYALA